MEGLPTKEVFGVSEIKQTSPSTHRHLHVEFYLYDGEQVGESRSFDEMYEVLDDDADGKVRARIGEALTKFLRGEDA